MISIPLALLCINKISFFSMNTISFSNSFFFRFVEKIYLMDLCVYALSYCIRISTFSGRPFLRRRRVNVAYTSRLSGPGEALSSEAVGLFKETKIGNVFLKGKMMLPKENGCPRCHKIITIKIELSEYIYVFFV